MTKYYKTAKGRDFDQEAYLLQHPPIPAIGNANVDSKGNPLPNTPKEKKKEFQKKSPKEQHQQRYEGQVVDAPIISGRKVAAQQKQKFDKESIKNSVMPKTIGKEAEIKIAIPTPIREDILDTPVEEITNQQLMMKEAVTKVVATPKSEPTIDMASGGLAAALAKAKESRQEPMKTERQQVREKTGVKKI